MASFYSFLFLSLFFITLVISRMAYTTSARVVRCRGHFKKNCNNGECVEENSCVPANDCEITKKSSSDFPRSSFDTRFPTLESEYTCSARASALNDAPANPPTIQAPEPDKDDLKVDTSDEESTSNTTINPPTIQAPEMESGSESEPQTQAPTSEEAVNESDEDDSKVDTSDEESASDGAIPVEKDAPVGKVTDKNESSMLVRGGYVCAMIVVISMSLI